MSDEPPSAYRARAEEVAALPGVSDARWFSNACRGRRDLPMRIAEFSTLGVFEVGSAFVAPSTGPGALHYLRTQRPGQGVLTGRPTMGLLVVLIGARSAEGASALRDWADFVHIRHIAAAAVPGYTMITPYEKADGGDPRFLHLYEMDCDDPEVAFGAMTGLVQERLGSPGTPAFDAWAGHEQLRIFYVNTFRLAGRV